MNAVKVESLNKQFMVNNMALPYDLKQIINGFCFYDAKTWDIMERKKQFMEFVNVFFKHCLSRGTPKCEHCSEWVVGDESGDPEADDYKMLALNCRRCGNYISIDCHVRWQAMSDTMKCHCV
jgi:hypothetical protein